MQTNPLLFSLPGPGQTLLLRSALLPRPQAEASWSAWMGSVRENSSPATTLTDASTGFKRLLALLGHHLRGCSIPASDEIHERLRAARLREQIRSDAARSCAGEALKRLTESGLRPLLLRGFLFDETLYPEPSLRHCHDLDLWLERSQWPAAETCLRGAGYVRIAESQMSLVLRHKSGFPVSLHSRLFRLPAFEQSATDLTQSRRSLQILGQSLDVLTPPAALLHLCGHAVTTGSHISPTWASDLWFLVNHDPNRVWREPQWSSLLISSIGKSAAPLALATLTALRYLKENLDITVPAPVCQALESAYGSSGEVDKAAWSAALLCAEGRPRELLRFGNGWSYRAAALRYLLAPPASILRREAGDNQSLASLYVQRFRRFLSASALG